MKKVNNTELTREMLEQMGISQVTWDPDNKQWWIDRYWFKTRSKNIRCHTHVQIKDAVCKHKYTQNKSYPIVVFSYLGKSYSIPLARFIYAWFKGKVAEGEVIDHIDNNPYNNKIDVVHGKEGNLQAMSQEANLKKRYIDNPNANRNQWDAIKKREEFQNEYFQAKEEEEYWEEVVYYYKETQSDLVELCNNLIAKEKTVEECKKCFEEVSTCIKDKMC